jgi:hypothetical protein
MIGGGVTPAGKAAPADPQSLRNFAHVQNMDA